MYERVRELVNDGYEVETIVSVIIAESDTVALREMSKTWVREAVARLKRGNARNAESRIQRCSQLNSLKTEAANKGAAQRALADAFEAFVDHLDTPFRTSRGGRDVTWGTATVTDHAQRKQYLRMQAVGLETTAARHELAIELLEATGLKCLGERWA
jgi:hypothetical protein